MSFWSLSFIKETIKKKLKKIRVIYGLPCVMNIADVIKNGKNTVKENLKDKKLLFNDDVIKMMLTSSLWLQE